MKNSMSLPASQGMDNQALQTMKMELHSKGSVLSNAWSDLFNFLSKYQAELTLKENAVEIAEQELCLRRKRVDQMKSMFDSGDDEVSKLQEEIETKGRQLNKLQTELLERGEVVQTLQLDLNSNQALLDKFRSDYFVQHEELVRYKGDLEKLQSELSIKREEIQFKDNLLEKVQNQLLRENADLKEQLEFERKALDLERRSHEQTKKSLQERPRISSSGLQTEADDTPPLIDLSTEHYDFGITTNEPQPMEEDSVVSVKSNPAKSLLPGPTRAASISKRKQKPKQTMSLASPDVIIEGASRSAATATSSSSDVYFPLSVSGDETETETTIIDTSDMLADENELKHVNLDLLPRTPCSETSESSGMPESPVPISQPIPSKRKPKNKEKEEKKSSRARPVYALNDERYNIIFHNLKGSNALQWKDIKTDEERRGYRASKNGTYVIDYKFNPLTNLVEERLLDRLTLRIVPKLSEFKKIIKMYQGSAPQGGARALSVAISKHFTGMGEKIVRRYLTGKHVP